MADIVGLIAHANSRFVSVGQGTSTANANSKNGTIAAETTRVDTRARSSAYGDATTITDPIRAAGMDTLAMWGRGHQPDGLRRRFYARGGRLGTRDMTSGAGCSCGGCARCGGSPGRSRAPECLLTLSQSWGRFSPSRRPGRAL